MYFKNARYLSVQHPRKMAMFDCIERPLSVFFYKYGKFVAKHPWPFILAPIFITSALALGILRINEV